MIQSKMQSELKSLDVTYKGYELLIFMKENFFTNIKGADLQRMRPLVFREARDVKQAFDELVVACLIRGTYDKGNISSIEPNVSELVRIQDISSGITVTKKASTKKKTAKSDMPESVKDILLHYNSHASLPRPSTATPLVISRIESKLEIYSPEQIKDALTFASEQSWLVNKGSEVWCNCAWVINIVEEFMDGGKYKKGTASSVSATDKYKIEDDNTTVFW